jgi:hypothetical protein
MSFGRPSLDASSSAGNVCGLRRKPNHSHDRSSGSGRPAFSMTLNGVCACAPIMLDQISKVLSSSGKAAVVTVQPMLRR